MIGPVEAAARSALAAVAGDWPVRWPNDAWKDLPSGWKLSNGDMPLKADGRPAPAIEAEVIGGRDETYAGTKGAPRGMRSGLIRIYLSVGKGTGTDALTEKSDVIVPAFKGKTLWADAAAEQKLVTGGVRIDDGSAGYEDGNRFVRMISVEWDFYYRA